MSNIPVLIVGAGPTGLMMAYELSRHGISFRIIDKKTEPTQTANAVALQTRTLEIFKQIGLADGFLRTGRPCKAICFYDHGKQYAQANFTHLNSVYQFILALPQAATEKILDAKLAELQHHIERSRTLIDVKINLTDIEAVVQHEDGVQEVIRCQWLLGCDGAHSTVREKCGFHFPGDDLSDQFIVADAVLDSYLPHDQIHIFSSNGLMLGTFPLGGNQFRLGGNLRLDYPRKDFTANELRDLVSTRSANLMSVRDVTSISPFWIHSKMSETMRRGNVFLLGDAAHIHSPIGGQGMNTGLQDAHNLAWKLALVIQDRANDTLLDSYQIERKPVIKEVVETTERFTKFLLMTNPFILFLRKQIIRLMLAIPSINNYITRRMTQLSIRYQPNMAMSDNAGERAPDVVMSNDVHFYDYLNDSHHHVMCFTGENDIFKMADFCKQVRFELLGPYKDLIKLHLVTPHAIDEPIDQIHDENNAIHQAYQIKKPSIIIIRPDGYINYKSTNLNVQQIKSFLSSYLI